MREFSVIKFFFFGVEDENRKIYSPRFLLRPRPKKVFSLRELFSFLCFPCFMWCVLMLAIFTAIFSGLSVSAEDFVSLFFSFRFPPPPRPIVELEKNFPRKGKLFSEKKKKHKTEKWISSSGKSAIACPSSTSLFSWRGEREKGEAEARNWDNLKTCLAPVDAHKRSVRTTKTRSKRQSIDDHDVD